MSILALYRRLPAHTGVRLRILILLLAVAVVPTAMAMRAPVERAQVSRGRFAPAAAAQPPERSIVGTLDSVDAKTMQIVVSTATGKQTLHLQTGATIRQGAKTVKASELSSHKGERVKVRYRETAGVQQAEWIVVASPAAPRKPKHTEPDPSSRAPLPPAR
ncbi:MAG: hypothetical protein V7647_4127 [Acidobacteriota bacterium]